MITLNLLGPVTAAINGRPFDRFGTIRGRALLIYLALENDRAHQREALMHLLWPDMPLKSAQGNLRQTLYLLRKALEDAGVAEPPFLTARQTVQINPDFLLAVDVPQFESDVAAGTPQNRQTAADLYRGPFLSDFFLPDSEPYEAWAAGRRAAYGRLALDNLHYLAANYLTEAAYAAAEETARRALALDDLHEPAHRQLIEALAGGGDMRAAIDHYESFRRRLAEELDVEPSPATQTLVEAIRRGDLPLKQVEVETAVAEPARVPCENLPAQTKPFIGREAELQHLDQFFGNPDTRLVTILGPGGMGKTQLAIEWARGQASGNGQTRYQDGAHFVNLAPLERVDQVVPAMAELFAFPLQGESRSPEQQMLDYLREKKLLLIFDNFEHLVEASSFVNDLLHAAPGVDLLITSRERLQLSSEQVYAIEGLAYPPDPSGQAGAEDFEYYPAVQLLLRSARRIFPDYGLAGEDREAAARICHYTAGMPLAIELAAAWIDMMPLPTIAAKIEECLDVLETDMRDMPARHRSIRAAINTTWNHLEAAEQHTFATLSIFRGGFTWEAATAVLDHEGGAIALRRTLSRLQDKSLLVYDVRSQRFTIHELLRQYGAEKLAAAATAAARERHALYYTELLRDNEPELKGPDFATTLQRIEADLENCLLAWHWLVENERRLQLVEAMESLGLFHEIRSYNAPGKRLFKAVTACWQKRLAGDEARAEDLRFLAKSLAWQAAFEPDRQETESLLQQSLDLLDDPQFDGPQGSAEKAFAYYRLGQTHFDSQMAQAIAYLNQGVTLYEGLGDLWGLSYCLQYLGFTNLFVNLESCRHYLLKAGEVFERSGDNRGLAQTLNWLVGAAALQGDDQTMAEAVRKYRALVAGMEPQAFFEETLYVNSLISEVTGQYRDTVAYREKLAGFYEELGRNSLAQLIYLATSYLHAGQFTRGHALLLQVQEALQETAVEHDHRLAFCRHVLATLALTEDAFAQAQDYLQAAMPVYKKHNTLPDLAGAHNLTGIALTGQGNLGAARPHFFTGLEIAIDHRSFIALGETLLGIALLLAQQGQTHKAQAVYEMAWRHPRFEKSALYDAVVGKKIRTLTTGISPADLEAFAQQAAKSDIWQEAASLLDELRTAGWENANHHHK